MTVGKAIEYAVSEIPTILPYLDKENIEELCGQILKNNEIGSNKWNSDGIANGFIDILGATDASFDFVFQFNEKLMTSGTTSIRNDDVQTFSNIQEDNNNTTTSTPETNTKKIITTNITPVTHLKKPNNAPADKNKEPPSEKKPKKTVKIENLNEIETYLKKIELNGDSTNAEACNCQGARHGLFEIVPNCLSCGKIICMKEGKNSNNCSFCKTELLPMNERLKIIEVLDKEKKLLLETSKKKPNSTDSKSKTSNNKKQGLKLQNNKGGNFWENQQKFFDQVEREKERERKREQVLKDQEQKEQDRIREEEEQDSSLKEARSRLETLLHYQNTSAERTKIIDNASDFSISDDVNGIWGSTYERALMVKKQQRNLNKLEKLKRERSGRDKVVVDISIDKSGKAVMRQKLKSADDVVYAKDNEILSDDEGNLNTEELEEMNMLENRISDDKLMKQKKLYNASWNYEEDQKQFKVPVYTKTSIETPESEDSNVQWKNKVQINDNDANLEENILAVL